MSQRDQKGAKREPKGTKRQPKAAKGEPKVCQRATNMFQESMSRPGREKCIKKVSRIIRFRDGFGAISHQKTMKKSM